MKRALIAIPLGSLLIGAFLYVWHSKVRPVEEPSATAGNAPTATGRDPFPSPPISNPNPPALPPNLPRGSLRIYAHARGLPLGGVKVTLFHQEIDVPLSAVTEPDGTRLLSGIPAGEWEIMALQAPYIPVRNHVKVEASKTIEIVLEFQGGGRIYGTVTDPQGQPVQGASVHLLDAKTKMFLHPELAASTDATGRYGLEGIPLTELGVHFRHGQYKPAMKMGLVLRVPGESIEVNGALERGSVVGGRVIGNTGTPLEGAQVIASTQENSSLILTDTQGTFMVAGLGDEPIHLSVSFKGYGTAYVRGVKPDTTGLEIRMMPGGSVSGRIVADPLPESFSVILVRYDEYFQKKLRVTPRTFMSVKQGEFLLTDVAAGAYWVEVEARGWELPDPPQIAVQPGQATEGVLLSLRKK